MFFFPFHRLDFFFLFIPFAAVLNYYIFLFGAFPELESNNVNQIRIPLVGFLISPLSRSCHQNFLFSNLFNSQSPLITILFQWLFFCLFYFFVSTLDCVAFCSFRLFFQRFFFFKLRTGTYEQNCFFGFFLKLH